MSVGVCTCTVGNACCMCVCMYEHIHEIRPDHVGLKSGSNMSRRSHDSHLSDIRLTNILRSIPFPFEHLLPSIIIIIINILTFHIFRSRKKGYRISTKMDPSNRLNKANRNTYAARWNRKHLQGIQAILKESLRLTWSPYSRPNI